MFHDSFIMNYLDHTYVVILCGGTGTRVWPLSIKKKPKQFINFYSDKTLFQGALTRAKLISPPERIILVTNEKYVHELKKQAPDIPAENIIAETEKKNTAMAMGVAAGLVLRKDKDAVLVNLPSDHVVKDNEFFAETMKTAAKIAWHDKYIVTVGIQPTYPHPGFGYIKMGNQLKVENDLEISKVDSFKEKPDIETAKSYLASGKYLWNAGFYIWRADTLIEEFQTHSPDIGKHITNLSDAFGTEEEKEVLKKEYSLVPEAPVDIAIAEKTDKLVVVPGKFYWNDVGSWQVVYELGEKDHNQNVMVKSIDASNNAPVETYDTTGTLVYSHNQPIAIVGLKDVAVVDTGSGILVCKREQSNDVKKIVQSLKDKGLEEYI
jgi:mannose-1-phosphate guanylyltransferase